MTRSKTVSRIPRGFTLIELMIVVAIIGILAAIAYPIYTDKVSAARRVDAKRLILQAAARQEQLYNGNQHRYVDSMNSLGLPAQTENGAYRVSVSQPGNDPQRFLVAAVASGAQQEDVCYRLTVDNTGRKLAYDSDGVDVTDSCW